MSAEPHEHLVPKAGDAPVFRRILLKLSGEALMGDRPFGIDEPTVHAVAREIADVLASGVEVAIVIGGGNIYRGLAASAEGMDRASADYAFGKKALLAAGVAYDSFQRDSMQDGFKAKKFWAGGSCEVRKDMVVKVRIEDTLTRLFSSEVQGRASVDFSF